MFHRDNSILSFYKFFGDSILTFRNGNSISFGSSFQTRMPMLMAPPLLEEAKERNNLEPGRKQSTNGINIESLIHGEEDEHDIISSKLSDILPPLSPYIPSPTPRDCRSSPFSPFEMQGEQLPRYLRQIELSPLRLGCEITEIKITDDNDDQYIGDSNAIAITPNKDSMCKIVTESTKPPNLH